MYFDIGANVGKWAKENIKHVDKIICVEASPKTYSELIKNINNDVRNNIICLNCAVCDTSDNYILFYESSISTLSSLNKEWLTSKRSRFHKTKKKIKKIKVKTISIDNLIKTYGIPDLIKVDVEGAENIALKSLNTKTPLLCFEWAAEWLNENIECINHLYDIGFRNFHLQSCDSYDYRPSDYKDTKDSIIEKLKKAKNKQDWGMIWCN